MEPLQDAPRSLNAFEILEARLFGKLDGVVGFDTAAALRIDFSSTIFCEMELRVESF